MQPIQRATNKLLPDTLPRTFHSFPHFFLPPSDDNFVFITELERDENSLVEAENYFSFSTVVKCNEKLELRPKVLTREKEGKKVTQGLVVSQLSSDI